MIEVVVTPQMRQRAREKIERLVGMKGRQSYQFGSQETRILDGYVGEQVVMSLFNGAVPVDDFDCDFVHAGVRYEVKTISCKAQPRPHYLATVNSCEPGKQHRQRADRYVFVRLRSDHAVAWVVGSMGCQDFLERGKFITCGTAFFPGHTLTKADATVLPISSLEGLWGRGVPSVESARRSEEAP